MNTLQINNPTAKNINKAFDAVPNYSLGDTDKYCFIRRKSGRTMQVTQCNHSHTFAGCIKIDGKTTWYKSDAYFLRKIKKLIETR